MSEGEENFGRASMAGVVRCVGYIYECGVGGSAVWVVEGRRIGGDRAMGALELLLIEMGGRVRIGGVPECVSLEGGDVSWLREG